VHYGARQPLIYSVRCESVPVKSRQSFESAEPQKAARVAHDPLYSVMPKSVSGSVDLERQALRSNQYRCVEDKPDR
jgi:hypothetical protein